jgi:endonuclease/exonuclease/phosphatase family metal-dependent hydrolase
MRWFLLVGFILFIVIIGLMFLLYTVRDMAQPGPWSIHPSLQDRLSVPVSVPEARTPLHLMVYNVCFGLPLYRWMGNRIRSKLIADWCTKQQQDIDVWVFIEVHHAHSRDRLRKDLLAYWPYACGGGSGLLADHGIMVMSKTPLTCLKTISFDDSSGIESFMVKGAMVLETMGYRLAVTHLQSQPLPSHGLVRLHQIDTIMKCLAEIPGQPVDVVVGDMNTIPHGSEVAEWMSRWTEWEPVSPLQDWYRKPSENGSGPMTDVDANNLWIGMDGSAFDYGCEDAYYSNMCHHRGARSTNLCTRYSRFPFPEETESHRNRICPCCPSQQLTWCWCRKEKSSLVEIENLEANSPEPYECYAWKVGWFLPMIVKTQVLSDHHPVRIHIHPYDTTPA